MNGVNRKWYSGMTTQEDWWAVWLGLFMFTLGLLSVSGIDAVGWQMKVSMWSDISKGIVPSGKAYAGLGPWGSLFATYVVWGVLFGVGASFMGQNVVKFLIGFTVIWGIAVFSWVVGEAAVIGAPASAWKKYGITWGLQLGEASYILCLVFGLIIGNFIKPLAEFLKDAAKPEWFIKTAIVYLGIKIGEMSLNAAGYALDIAIAGACATFVAYLLFWPIIYVIARRWFSLPRQWAAVLCSGISICGVSAAIATAGAIRAKPIIPAMISILIIIYAMVELVVLPGFYTWVAPHDPVVNGAAMGMTVKTDGADAAAGAVLDSMMRALPHGQNWVEGSILAASIMTKIWIDIFIGVWAFILALIWVYKVERQPGQSHVPVSEVWFRFPKFVIGYLFCWFFIMAFGAIVPDLVKPAMAGWKVVSGPMRNMLFMMCFVAMGCITDFSKLRGLGRLALLYAIGLVFVIAPIAYFVAWLFHHGMMPPTVS